jgi:hypothetical protein
MTVAHTYLKTVKPPAVVSSQKVGRFLQKSVWGEAGFEVYCTVVKIHFELKWAEIWNKNPK